MPKSTFLDNALLNAVLRATAYTSPTTVYVALFNGNPSSGGSEVSGGSYARQPATFSAASAGSTSNTAGLTYTNMPVATITYVAIYDAVTAGNLLYFNPAAASKTTNATDTVSIAAGGIVVNET
jgi:hypothetical protein